jgi:aminodeoxyfutalosine deaminase
MTSSPVAAFVAALPKVELHVHLVGSASIPTVLELARRRPDVGVPTDEAGLRAFYEFTDFAHFIDVYIAVNSLVVSGADIEALVVGLARDLATQNVRYAEVTVTPYSHLHAGIPAEDVAAGLDAGRRRALAEHGVQLAWVFDIPSECGPESGMETVGWVLDHQPEGTVAFGLGGPENNFPRAAFRGSFDLARAAGLHSAPHAGETTGPESIWSAVHDLGAERIGHGINAVHDPRLLDYLGERGIALEVCPTSNICTVSVPALDQHPLPRLLEAGVLITLNTDDPGMFHTTLNREYEIAHDVFGLSAADLAELTRNAARAAFCDDALRRSLLAEIDAVAATAPA